MSPDPAGIATAAAIVAAVLYLGIAAFQLALALGAPWGRAAYGGQHPGAVPPRLRVSSAVALVVWAAVALVVLRRVGLVLWAPLPDAWLPVALWVVVGFGAVAVLLNAITPSRTERVIWLPTAVLLFVSTLTVALAA